MQDTIVQPGEEGRGRARDVLFGLVALCAVALIVYGGYSTRGKQGDTPIATATTTFSFEAYRDIEIEGESAIVWDIRTQRPLYEKNPEAQLPLASISKLMTALVADKYLNNEEAIVIEDTDLKAEGDNGLYAGDTWTYENLRNFTLVVSSNDGARALASAAEARVRGESNDTVLTFIDLMNERAEALGLRQTYFLNPSGLDVEATSISGSYGSARDMALLLEYMLLHTPHVLEATSQSTISVSSKETRYEAKNTNKLLPFLSGVIASKTGFTDLAGGNLAVVFDVSFNRPVVLVVLSSSKEGRFSDIETLYNATLDYFDENYSLTERN